jgi:hypothetical protein
MSTFCQPIKVKIESTIKKCIHMKFLHALCATMLFIAYFKLPIGYYTILRIAVTIGAGFICYSEYQKGSGVKMILFGAIAVIFNPIIPVYLGGRSVWRPVDIAAGLAFAWYALKESKFRGG